MRRVLLLCVGVMEFVVALALLSVAWQLPGAQPVGDAFRRAERVSRQTSGLVGRLRGQLYDLKQKRPELVMLSRQLKTQMDVVLAQVKEQRVDFNIGGNLDEALGHVARGLDGIGETFDPESLRKIGQGLNGAADFLDAKLAPAASQAALQLERSADTLKADAVRLRDLARSAPDLTAARQIHDGLAKLTEALDKSAPLARAENAAAMRDGFKGLETALNAGADEVKKLAESQYPVFSLIGMTPKIEAKPYWPEGTKIAEGMRKAGAGAAAAAREMSALVQDLPRIQKALEATRQTAEGTRLALAEALKRQLKTDPLLKDLPEHAARLAEELPELSAGLARVLRDTGKLKDAAAVLRQVKMTLDEAARRWPDLRANLARASELLRTAQTQLKKVLMNRGDYERSLDEAVRQAAAFSSDLPRLTDSLGRELDDQERSLGELQISLGEVSDTLPAAGAGLTRLMQTIRLLLVLGALVFLLHGAALVVGDRGGRRHAVVAEQ
jgi:hypothetical protein